MRYIALVLMAGLIGSAEQTPVDVQAVEAFQRGVEAYSAIHHRVEAGLPPQVSIGNAATLFARRHALAAAIRAERAQARQGDIFTVTIDDLFRRLVVDAVQKGGIRDMLAIVEDENTVHVPPQVNGDYPAGRSIALMPPCLLAALPPLPPELRYGFAGRDLILWDVDAGLIVDFLPNVIPKSRRHTL